MNFPLAMTMSNPQKNKLITDLTSSGVNPNVMKYTSNNPVLRAMGEHITKAIAEGTIIRDGKVDYNSLFAHRDTFIDLGYVVLKQPTITDKPSLYVSTIKYSPISEVNTDLTSFVTICFAESVNPGETSRYGDNSQMQITRRYFKLPTISTSIEITEEETTAIQTFASKAATLPSINVHVANEESLKQMVDVSRGMMVNILGHCAFKSKMAYMRMQQSVGEAIKQMIRRDCIPLPLQKLIERYMTDVKACENGGIGSGDAHTPLYMNKRAKNIKKMFALECVRDIFAMAKNPARFMQDVMFHIEKLPLVYLSYSQGGIPHVDGMPVKAIIGMTRTAKRHLMQEHVHVNKGKFTGKKDVHFLPLQCYMRDNKTYVMAHPMYHDTEVQPDKRGVADMFEDLEKPNAMANPKNLMALTALGEMITSGISAVPSGKPMDDEFLFGTVDSAIDDVEYMIHNGNAYVIEITDDQMSTRKNAIMSNFLCVLSRGLYSQEQLKKLPAILNSQLKTGKEPVGAYTLDIESLCVKDVCMYTPTLSDHKLVFGPKQSRLVLCMPELHDVTDMLANLNNMLSDLRNINTSGHTARMSSLKKMKRHILGMVEAGVMYDKNVILYSETSMNNKVVFKDPSFAENVSALDTPHKDMFSIELFPFYKLRAHGTPSNEVFEVYRRHIYAQMPQLVLDIGAQIARGSTLLTVMSAETLTTFSECLQYLYDVMTKGKAMAFYGNIFDKVAYAVMSDNILIQKWDDIKLSETLSVTKDMFNAKVHTCLTILHEAYCALYKVRDNSQINALYIRGENTRRLAWEMFSKVLLPVLTQGKMRYKKMPTIGSVADTDAKKAKFQYIQTYKDAVPADGDDDGSAGYMLAKEDLMYDHNSCVDIINSVNTFCMANQDWIPLSLRVMCIMQSYHKTSPYALKQTEDARVPVGFTIDYYQRQQNESHEVSIAVPMMQDVIISPDKMNPDNDPNPSKWNIGCDMQFASNTAFGGGLLASNVVPAPSVYHDSSSLLDNAPKITIDTLVKHHGNDYGTVLDKMVVDGSITDLDKETMSEELGLAYAQRKEQSVTDEYGRGEFVPIIRPYSCISDQLATPMGMCRDDLADTSKPSKDPYHVLASGMATGELYSSNPYASNFGSHYMQLFTPHTTKCCNNALTLRTLNVTMRERLCPTQIIMERYYTLGDIQNPDGGDISQFTPQEAGFLTLNKFNTRTSTAGHKDTAVEQMPYMDAPDPENIMTPLDVPMRLAYAIPYNQFTSSECHIAHIDAPRSSTHSLVAGDVNRKICSHKCISPTGYSMLSPFHLNIK